MKKVAGTGSGADLHRISSGVSIKQSFSRLTDLRTNRFSNGIAWTLCSICSINKIFTRIALGQLLEQKKLSLQDTVLKHYPDYPNPQIVSKITIEQLINMESGMGDILAKHTKRVRKKLIGHSRIISLSLSASIRTCARRPSYHISQSLRQSQSFLVFELFPE